MHTSADEIEMNQIFFPN